MSASQTAKKKIRVAVAMSGGVDSSLSAALLKEKGYDVIGLTMHLWDRTEGAKEKFGRCCSPEDTYDARRVCEYLEIPHYVVNFRKAFEERVVDYFVREYLEGRTPNPCIKCNEEMKFRLLLQKARDLDARGLATGHYARIQWNSASGRYSLLRGSDRRKDQSYFLFSMSQEQMQHVIFPLGEKSKAEVRELALRVGLRVAGKADSQEICFIPDDNYRNFVGLRKGTEIGAAGEIVDLRGKVLGRHGGIHSFTIGQRRGLGIAGPSPLYVLALDRERNRVVAGTREELMSGGLIAGNVNWVSIPGLNEGTEASVQIRYRHPGVAAVLAALPGGKVRAEFQVPQRSVTPGQAAVFYRGEEVLGGGWIERAL